MSSLLETEVVLQFSMYLCNRIHKQKYMQVTNIRTYSHNNRYIEQYYRYLAMQVERTIYNYFYYLSKIFLYIRHLCISYMYIDKSIIIYLEIYYFLSYILSYKSLSLFVELLSRIGPLVVVIIKIITVDVKMSPLFSLHSM